MTELEQIKNEITQLKERVTALEERGALQHEWLTVAQVSQFLQLDHKPIRRWISEGKLAAKNLGGEGKAAEWRISRAAVNALMGDS